MPHLSSRRTYLFYAIGLIVVAFIAFHVGVSTEAKKIPPPPVDVRENSSAYQFINPLLFERTSKTFYAAEFKTYTDTISSYINSVKSSIPNSSVSVYFRDLNSGDWTGVNENDTYEPASMLKVVVMMSTLDLASENPAILTEKLYYAGAQDSGQNYKPNDGLTPGYYTVNELINAMIIYSDNGATASLLGDKTINAAFQATYQLFRLPIVATATTTDYMSARSYSVVFRSLYNADFLSDSLSEQALHLLSQTTFTQGLAAGVPTSTTVSHKFGEYAETLPSGVSQKELHDCGIVYYPAHPYLLCVMAKGPDFPSLQNVLSTISGKTYAYVMAKNP